MSTKVCENCEKEIGDSEAKCPACGVVFEDLEDAVMTVERANKILEKRKKATAPPEPPPPVPPAPQSQPVKKESPLMALGKVIRRK